jgi:ubiquinone/menaquinone biosynthesis C-methylase UbiE
MTQPSITTPPADLEAVKRKQQATWASGDYSAVGALIPIISEDLCDAADLRAGSRVLDVAGGSGNTALAAARMFCDVVSLDYVPSLLERGRERAAAEQLPVRFVEGDAEALPFEDASFDAVISVVGVMFAPDHERAASELVRVCRPGGTIALASWTPRGFIGGLLRTVGKHVPPPAGVRPPTLWGDEDHLRGLLGTHVDALRTERRTYTFRYRSPEHFVDFFEAYYGPTHKAFAALDDHGRAALRAHMIDLVRSYDRLGDGDDTAVAITAEYLQAVGTRGR